VPFSSKESLMFVLAQKAQLIEASSRNGSASFGGHSSCALDPFVVTKHQPSNGQRAMAVGFPEGNDPQCRERMTPSVTPPTRGLVGGLPVPLGGPVNLEIGEPSV
jgi:hypothetical protein